MHRSLHLATRNAPEPVRMTVAQTVGRRMLPARSFHIHRYAFDFTGEWKGGCIVAGYGSAAVLTDTEQLDRPRVAEPDGAGTYLFRNLHAKIRRESCREQVGQ